jgi:hypothetical protein
VGQRDAARLAEETGRLYGDPGAHVDAHAYEKIKDAVYQHALRELPRAAAAVVQREDLPPVALAVEGERIYALTAEPPEGDFARVPTTCRLITLDPKRDTVAMTAEYRPVTVGPHLVGWGLHAEWKFKLDDLELTVKTHTNEDGESDERDRVARQIAAQLGWQFPDPSELRQGS